MSTHVWEIACARLGQRKTASRCGGRSPTGIKKCVTLDLNKPEGQEILKQLVADADVLTENFRPGTLERWGLGWDVLHALNPRLIVARVSGFGQTGPYKDKPGFGTLAEAMSGFAHITGQPDGPPTLPGFGLADAVAGQFGTWSVMFALYERDNKSGKGQMIDLSGHGANFYHYWGSGAEL